MAAAATLIQTQTQTPFTFIAPNEFQLPSYSCCFTKNTYHVIFRCQNNNNYQRFRIYSIPKPSTSRYISTRKPLSLYLIEKLSFSEEQSLAISKRLVRSRSYHPPVRQVRDLISFENADNVIKFLQDYCGLDLTHVKKLVNKFPSILGSNVDKTIKPKIKLVQDLGFSTSDLAHVLSTNPYLYLYCDLSPSIKALRGIMGSDEDVVKFFRQMKYGSVNRITHNLIPNVTMLENEYGIPRDKIRKFMTQSPQPITGRTEWLRDVLVRIEHKWGITRDSSLFLRALLVFGGLSDEKINSKCQVFRSYGWSDSNILSLIRRLPNSLGLSEAGINKKLEFYMNKLGYEPACLIAQPALFSYSLENRVVPRYRVLSILKEKGLVKATGQLYYYTMMPEDRFFNKCILPYEEILPNLRDVYIDRRAPSEVTLLKEAYENES